MFKITERNNFCRVFKLPTTYPEEFCFGGGRPVIFIMVDWLNPIQLDLKPEKLVSNSDMVVLRDELKEYIKEKNYYDKASKYLIITDYNDSFLI